MKELSGKIFANLHILVLLYGIYGAYVLYEEHIVQLEEVQNRSTGLDQDIIVTEKKYKEIQEFSKKTEEYKIRVEEVAKNIEAVQKQLPLDTNDTQILSHFKEEMALLNIKDPTLVPGKEETGAYYISKDYEIKAKGTFLQFLIFLERLGNNTRIYNVKSLKLVNSTTNLKGRFQIIDGEGTVTAYRMNPAFKVDRGFEKTDSGVK